MSDCPTVPSSSRKAAGGIPSNSECKREFAPRVLDDYVLVKKSDMTPGNQPSSCEDCKAPAPAAGDSLDLNQSFRPTSLLREKVVVARYASKRGKSEMMDSGPPRLLTTFRGTNTVRFGCTTGGAYSITVANLLGSLGVIGKVSNSSVVAVMSSVKLDHIKVWSSASSSTLSTAAVDWSAGQSSQVPDENVDDTIPQGTSVPSGLLFKPPRSSLASFWITSADSSAVLFKITVQAGSIVDVQCSYRMCDTISPLSITVATAVVGAMYYLALDGPTSNKLASTSMPSTS